MGSSVVLLALKPSHFFLLQIITISGPRHDCEEHASEMHVCVCMFFLQ